MKKLITFTFASCVIMVIFIMIGCGTQNEYLSKGKEWVKSDKRGRIPKAIAQFELAIEKEPDNAEAHYLLGYYDENATIERRTEQMVLAYNYDKRKYLKILIEEAIRDRDENVRKSALKALQDIHRRDSIMKTLVKVLKSKDSRDRDDAALVLSKLYNHKDVVDRLIQDDVLKHKRMATRFSAVRALGDIGDPVAIEPLIERITALKTEDEKGEEPEVRRAAVVALRQIARRNIEITEPLDLQVEAVSEGVKIVGEVNNKTTLQKGEIISRIIDNNKITSLEVYNRLLAEAFASGEEITFGLPKIIKVTVANIDELGIENIKPATDGKGIVIGNLTVESRAAKRGIEKGEKISYINDQPVNSEQDYKSIVTEAMAKGEGLIFRIADEGKYSLLTVPIPEGSQDLGMTVEILPSGVEGVIVTDVRPRSPAVESGIRKGQIISYVVIENKIQNVDEYRQLLEQGLADGKVTISVINKTAITKLIGVLQNKGLIVRFDAAQALGEVEDSEAVNSLIDMLNEQANPIEISLR